MLNAAAATDEGGGSSTDVFISYRRETSATLAIAIFHQLREFGVDCFYDIESIRAGQFEQIILGQIAARPYFLLVLSPGCLARCSKPDDWLRREIEEAVRLDRIIIPVWWEGFQLSEVREALPKELASAVLRHNRMELPQKFFKYAMREISEEWLRPVPSPSRSIPEQEAALVETIIQAAIQIEVSEDDLVEEGDLGRWKALVDDAESPPPPPSPIEVGFSGTQTAKAVGITYRQLDYWARTDVIRPSLAESAGSGSRRSYSYRDLVELRVIKSLLDAGLKFESVREVFAYLRQRATLDIASTHIVASANQVVLCDGPELVQMLGRGAGVRNVLSLSGVKNDIDAQLATLNERGDDGPYRNDDDGTLVPG